MSEVNELGKKAKGAARVLASLSEGVKNDALEAMARAIEARADEIIEANNADMTAAKADGVGEALLDRLMLDKSRLSDIAGAVREVIALRDPVGEIVKGWQRPNGLKINQVRVPLGVVGMIYEARPNVTVDAAALCLKTGNAVILRGGSMAIKSCLALIKVISQAAEAAGAPKNSIQMIESPDRAAATELMGLNEYVDVLIPRGGASLIQSVVKNATVPVIETGVGNCHIYVDAAADLDMARAIIVNAKCQRPGVCNAAESLVINKEVAKEFIPVIAADLKAQGVVMVGDEIARKLFSDIGPGTEADWAEEYLSLKLSIKTVGSLSEAIEHVNKYGSGHSEAIITEDYSAAMRFTSEVDAAAVYVNASTRFTDGGQFGLGAEIGISTQKLHVRGPMGLDALTSTKYIVYGNGQIRAQVSQAAVTGP
jgi:glutamate-5-semialdehyde dehydrogenase